MGFVIRLKQGTQTFEFSGRYSVAGNFTPPGGSGGEAKVALNINGSSRDEVEAGIDDLNAFLSQADDLDRPPMYFEWRNDSLTSVTLTWGQRGGPRRVQVLSGSAGKPGGYATSLPTLFVPDCILTMDTASGVNGHRQLWASAKGGVQEDRIGAAYDRSRGVIVPEADAANGNYFSNPIFSNSTWDNGYTAGAGMTATKNTNPDYVLFGAVSVKLVSASSTTGHFTSSINVGDTNAHKLSTYAIKADRSAFAGNEAQIYYNGNPLTTTFTSMGNGWYRLSASITGVASSVTAGILVFVDEAFYCDGFQLEKRAYLTPLMCGDFFGHAWLSAGHGSRSVRTASYVRLPVSVLDSYLYTIRIVWKAPRASTTYSGSSYILKSSASANFQLSWDGANLTWDFMTTAGPAASFAEGDMLVFDIVCRPATYSLYINGSLVVSDTGSLAPTSGYLYFGSDATPANHIGGTFGAEIYNGAMSGADLLSSYLSILPLLADDQAVYPIPWLWTKDGDDQVDNHNDVSTYDNYGVIGGIQGDLPAIVEAKLTVAGMNDADLFISQLDMPYDRYIDPEFMVYEGSPDAVTVNTSDTAIATLSIDDDEFRLLAGRKLAVMLRADEDGANNISLRTGINPGGAYYWSAYLPSNWIASGANTSIDLSPDLFMVDDEEFYRLLGITRAVSVQVQGKRPTGSATLNLVSAQIIVYPLTRFINQGAVGAAPTILYIGGSRKGYEVSSAGALKYTYSVDGAPLELIPNRYNLWTSFLGREAVLSEPADTLTYQGYVTPRWKVQ